jgi:hypothetical protein
MMTGRTRNNTERRREVIILHQIWRVKQVTTKKNKNNFEISLYIFLHANPYA